MQAIELDPAFTKNIGQIVLLGGAFLVNGNVNPASEANIFGDPEAADIVFTCGADVGYWAQYHDRDILAESDGIFAKYLSKILEFYFSYHRDAYNMKGVYLHDPTTILAAVNPSLMTYMEGVIRVQTTGITRGLSLFFNKQKRFNEETEWCNKPTVKVAVTVDAPEVVKLVMQRLMY
ncbi:putative inosine/uridine-preferring nucleoside hydrolase domain, ribonucleoside hydrolase [Helianthus annuus]|uniref:Inosine/uridine-preferring nucleoside hydrolase domain, ribonucleoside hydrolase n=1 Tax=Helianthus annuus TaxID=4232 RepID=A0A9K3NLW4_HELAN|nr:putative inosine/uridine-preferring nucleoside hydrolase domain, ribonucleoside hydrolase [Helianthus annuus]KAJ0569115.1 putative inosine/uridine-preferring nucleoside hydrolase domain, ribonucleoside hydrolase [Helianthus annuus]KAJ0583408.1 putative inosine/uridine-preferring nucleoside hydrolase domain, ribonucleoside hydrolase [Helianthus annuus]KAJ0749146.1 putative inosine/uridine-preferring nucleoside hydrolase domain, ribonucleoside hydrolase [Helianthus annuus]KAJ0917557.1 putative